MGMFNNIREKLKGKSIDREIDAAFSQNTKNPNGYSDSYSKKVLEASQNQSNQTNQFGMSDAYFHESPKSASRLGNSSQQQEMTGDNFNQSNQIQVPDYSEIPANNNLRISDPTKLDDPHLNMAPPQMPLPLNTQNTLQSSDINNPANSYNSSYNNAQQSRSFNEYQHPQVSAQQQFQEPRPIALDFPQTETPSLRRIESLLLEVRTLRAQNEQILEILQHLEKRSI